MLVIFKAFLRLASVGADIDALRADSLAIHAVWTSALASALAHQPWEPRCFLSRGAVLAAADISIVERSAAMAVAVASVGKGLRGEAACAVMALSSGLAIK